MCKHEKIRVIGDRRFCEICGDCLSEKKTIDEPKKPVKKTQKAVPAITTTAHAEGAIHGIDKEDVEGARA